MNKVIRKYRKLKLVILINDYAVLGGAMKPILGYFKYNYAQDDVLLLHPAIKYYYLKLVLVLLFSPNILINSLSSFKSWALIFVTTVRKDAVIYFHEAQTAVDAFQKAAPLKYSFLKKILSTNKVACISNYQQKYLKDHFNSETEIIGLYTPAKVSINRTEGRLVILMAGYLMERKGVSFYSELADHVTDELKLPWDFYWAGSVASKDKMYQSKNVKWLGEVELMDTIYPQIDAFFLASIDEPFGLVCIEALKYNKHIVAYKNSGAAEFIEAINGCKVYNDYNINSAFVALQSALNESVDKAAINKVISTFSIEAYVKRVDQLFKSK